MPQCNLVDQSWSKICKGSRIGKKLRTPVFRDSLILFLFLDWQQSDLISDWFSLLLFDTTGAIIKPWLCILRWLAYPWIWKRKKSIKQGGKIKLKITAKFYTIHPNTNWGWHKNVTGQDVPQTALNPHNALLSVCGHTWQDQNQCYSRLRLSLQRWWLYKQLIEVSNKTKVARNTS